MSQASHPILINLPPPSPTPDTPDMPGTPTSTTTSLSALSTIAIKDGHRGHLPQSNRHAFANPPTTSSLEAERADRISRLAGLERVSTALRASSSPASMTGGAGQQNATSNPNPANAGNPNNPNSYTNPHLAAYAFQQGHWLGAQGGPVPPPSQLTPAYFDASGQPVAITKISTVGTASATTQDEYNDSSSYYHGGDDETNTTEARTNPEVDEDMLSMENNYVPHLPGEVSSVMSQDGDDRRSYGGDGDLSDDGTASLVGFGEGAGSTISGPIYHRRPLPGVAGNPAAAGGAGAGVGQERERGQPGDIPSSPLRPGTPRSTTHLSAGGGEKGGGGETPVSASALQERRAARMTNGVAVDGVGGSAAAGDEFVDTTAREPVVLPGGDGSPSAGKSA